MSDMTKDQVMSMADMVRIALSEEEAAMYADQLNAELEYVQKINELNTDDVEPTIHGSVTMSNVLRKDIAKQSITQEEALKNAPEEQDGHFKVPSIME